MKKYLSTLALIMLVLLSTNCTTKLATSQTLSKKDFLETLKTVSNRKKTIEEKALFSKERELHDFNMQKNPETNTVTKEHKVKEAESALYSTLNASRLSNRSAATSNVYNFRGPSNLGGRTRVVVYDLSDPTGNTLISGGVSSGVFRSTNGGSSWTKVSNNSEINNVTCITQDPRVGFQNIWYYGTGEWSGNSASLGSAYRGQGVWKSINNGLTWSVIPQTSSQFHVFDTPFDYVNSLDVHPITGELYIAATGKIYKYDGTNITTEIELPSSATGFTDVSISNNGTIYGCLIGQGVYTKTGNGNWLQIGSSGSPSNLNVTGRMVLSVAPSNPNILYVLVAKTTTTGPEANLFQWNNATSTWIDYSSKLPDEPGGNLAGNDPFAVQGGYDLVVSIKPSDENFVVIGGTNAYKISNITTDAMFQRIGGYINNTSYAKYNLGGGDTHHPDIHSLVFNPFNNSVLISGTDGGIHKTNDINATQIAWINLNNNYNTYQYYHIGIDPQNNSDMIIGGAQDNGTTVGGISSGFVGNSTQMIEFWSGDGVAAAISRADPTNPLAFVGSQGGSIYKRLLKSPYTYTNIRPTSSTSQFVTYFYSDPVDNETLYYAGLQTIYRTTSASTVTTSNWNNLGTITDSNITTFESTRTTYNPTSSYLLIGYQNGKLYKLLDPKNVTSASLAVDITPTLASGYLSGISIHPTDSNIVLVTYASYGVNNIYLTNNANSPTPTWINIERNLTNHSCRSAMIVSINGEIQYYVGTARGLYFSLNPTTTDWTVEAPNTLGLAIISSLRYRPSDNKLLIGTHGSGIFETTLVNLGVDDFNKNPLNDLTIYPNPSNEYINVKYENKSISNEKYSIVDINGNYITNGTTNENGYLDVSSLAAGVYFIVIKINDKEIANKFIIQ